MAESVNKLQSACIPSLKELLSVEERTVDKLEALALSLAVQETQIAACKRLHELSDALQNGSNTSGLKLQIVPVLDRQLPIRLLLHPAIFAPEYWGRTFAEGLLKSKQSFDGKRVVELGTGSGWISIFLLLTTGISEVWGLDINPIAVTMARLNAWLNGTKCDGSYLFAQSGAPIPSAFRVLRSDLLEEPLSSGERFDCVIGCIPQVLHPDPLAQRKIQGQPSYKDLYDLSNYCFEQGILEDRFGLPLIARALEESQLCLKENGQVTLILGGRPGQLAIETMFRRRGFEPKLLWSRRIHQADDTDLSSLVQLEAEHGIRFNFFSSDSSKLPIPASTAERLLNCGHPIYHDLLVYQASTKFEVSMFDFIRHLHQMKLDEFRKELDFSRISEEQISFLSKFTLDLLQSRALPYPHERGDKTIRERLAKFLCLYCHQSVDSINLFVGPERQQLVSMVLSMIATSGDKILISSSLEPVYRSVLEQHGFDVVIGNDDISELLELDDLTNPTACLFSPQQLSNPSLLLLDALTKQAAAHPDRWYVIDDSQNFEISSNLESNAFLRLTAQHNLPNNLVVLYGLIKSTVAPDLELSFLINMPHDWIEGLEVGAELSYSRIAYPTQLYYKWLFDDLLAFSLSNGKNECKRAKEGVVFRRKFVDSFSKVAADPVFAAKPVDPESEELLRLDYGEFEGPVPPLLVKGMIKGFMESSPVGLPELMRERIAAYLQTTRGATVNPGRVVLSQGVFPSFGALIAALRERLGRSPLVALPNGSYGPCYPMVQYHGGTVVAIETDPAQGFMLKPEDLRRISPKPDLLWLTQPNNPSGLFIEPETVRALMRICAEREIFVLSDEIFFLLSDYRLGAWTPAHLSFAYFLDAVEKRWLFLTDGLSKAFAAGGLRCGFMVCPDEEFARKIQSRSYSPPISSLRAWDMLYSVFLSEAPHQYLDLVKEKGEIEQYLKEARLLLCQQRDQLIAVLKQCDLDDGLDTHYRGGLFVLAKLADKVEALAKESKLLVNPPEWGRTPGWCRICFSLTPGRFNEAMDRLKATLR